MAQEAAAPAEGETPTAESNESGDENNGKAPEAEPAKFDADYVKQLRAENAKWRIEAQQRQEKLEEYEESQKSELEKAQTKAQKLEQAKADAEAKLLRFEVAAEKQVPADALDLLTGNTREELEAKADKLLALVKNRTETDETPDFDGGAREPAEDTDPAKAHDNAVLKLLGLT